MPMYEYGCRTCAAHFTLLRRMEQDDADITCPDCGSSQIYRQFSVFASMGRESSGAAVESMPMPSGGGCCRGGGGCGCASKN